ncbi:MAG: hypothetical protein AVDCRST_MAG86-1350 [uncultured Truepera sp.]|uniref:DUF4097 domain-containing protein n=1 Tax=uncultured Truepera sp. TaxID=543023 RepID=A0A6J4V5G8_9DEIN|nr:MAG: hypothetical protein AVDCRST_MAG86-1350 [uncultured Truepera sp.]
MNDSERKRVQALLNSGRISEDEAEVLFAALNESETQGPDDAARLQVTPQEASEPEIPVPPTPSGVQPPLPPSALAQAARRSHQSPHSSSAVSTETPVTWVKLVGFCGDLDVRSDPSLSNPVVTGHATVERNDTGYLIRTPPDIKGADKGAGGNWLTRLHKAAGDVSVRLPAEMGLELGIAAGDGEVRGVKTLRGTFTGGDLDVLEAETVDLTVTAGDVTLKLRPRAGEGRLKATSGDVDVIFLAGSSAVITGSATCGDLDLPPGFTRSGGFATHKFEGTLGAGEARLELRLTAGDVDIRAEDV